MASSLAVFELGTDATAIDVYDKYTDHRAQLEGLRISKFLRDALYAVLNKAYDLALAETSDAREAVQSPR
tara:strand:- start:1875 stop:2084 length:210 start_codon:yes stop_codon:yes gene_type:complete